MYPLMSSVTVPFRTLGMRPRGPRTRPKRGVIGRMRAVVQSMVVARMRPLINWMPCQWERSRALRNVLRPKVPRLRQCGLQHAWHPLLDVLRRRRESSAPTSPLPRAEACIDLWEQQYRFPTWFVQEEKTSWGEARWKSPGCTGKIDARWVYRSATHLQYIDSLSRGEPCACIILHL